MQRILTPLDGSELAESALPYAELLARPGHATIVLVRVAHPSTLVADPVEAERKAMEEAGQYLDAIAGRLRDRGMEVEIALPFGDAAKWIVDEAMLRHTDLIVMATHGRGGLGRLLHGSVARKVLDLGASPLLLVRPGEPLFEDGRVRILVPLDGSALAESALPLAMDLARAHGGVVRLTRVVQLFEPALLGEGYPIGAIDYESERDQARAYLEKVGQRLRDTGISVELALRLGDVAVELETEARESHATMIALTTRARGGFDRLVFGSVADGLLRRVKLPLLILQPVRATESVTRA